MFSQRGTTQILFLLFLKGIGNKMLYLKEHEKISRLAV
jgi:hypothetical protein